MVKNLHEQPATNGIIGWCKLAQDSSSMTAQRLQGLANRVYSPKRCKLYTEVNAAIENWELQAATFARAQGSAPLDPVTKMYAISQIVPEELEKDIVRASNILTSYELIKKYVTEQVAVRRDVKNATKGPVPMDLQMATACQMLADIWTDNEKETEAEGGEEEACGTCDDGSNANKLFSFIQGLKGGGKGGKGYKGFQKGANTKFDGVCHHCGIYGHRIGECRKKDQEMAEKGKAEKQVAAMAAMADLKVSEKRTLEKKEKGKAGVMVAIGEEKEETKDNGGGKESMDLKMIKVRTTAIGETVRGH